MQKGMIVVLLLGILVLSIELAGGFGTQHAIKKELNPTPAVGIPVAPPQVTGTNNLQLKTFKFITPTTGTCQRDNTKSNGCTCVAYEHDGVVCENRPYPNGTCPDNGRPCTGFGGFQCDQTSCMYVDDINPTGYNKYKDQCSDHQICYGKPVIYLYPTQDTFVDVRLTLPGFVYVSNPLFDSKSSGWKQVLAHPNGKLEYHGKTYSELYYESTVTKDEVPTTGVFIKTNDLKQKLLAYTFQLGLVLNEQNELLQYWLPKLYKLNKPYIFFSILSPSQKDRVDHVTFSPNPETNIAFLMYFKGVDIPYTVAPLQLPTTPPQRIGFTSVEWGGTIAN